MSASLDIPVGALARYVLARWATAGSGGLLELGPVMVHRLWEPVERPEAADADEARLAGYTELKALLSWLKVPLDNPDVGTSGYLISAGPRTTSPRAGVPIRSGARGFRFSP
jgi:hypothetical protein